MIIIKLNEGCYVQPRAILILKKELALVGGAPVAIQAEWNAGLGDNPDRSARMLLPGIKAVLTDQREEMIHFGSEAARDERLDELVKQWREE